MNQAFKIFAIATGLTIIAIISQSSVVNAVISLGSSVGVDPLALAQSGMSSGHFLTLGVSLFAARVVAGRASRAKD